jgi:DNA-binding response OmpR family regulator
MTRLDLEFNARGRVVRRNNVEIRLTPTEFKILELLAPAKSQARKRG